MRREEDEDEVRKNEGKVEVFFLDCKKWLLLVQKKKKLNVTL